MNIRNRIISLRTLKGLSQENMADKLSIEVSTYGKIERGVIKLTLDRAEQIAGIFEMSLVELLNYGIAAEKQPVARAENSDDAHVLKLLMDEILSLRKSLETKDKQIAGILHLQKKGATKTAKVLPKKKK